MEVSRHLPPLTAVMEEPLPDVAGHNLGVFLVDSVFLLENVRHNAGNIPVGGAVRAVAADTVIGVHIIRDTVHIGGRGHGLMECGIKHKHLRYAGHCGKTALDTHDVCVGVQGSEVATEFELFQHFVGKQRGLLEVFAAVDNSVTDRLDLLHGLDATHVCIGKKINNDRDRCRMVRHRQVFFDLFAIREFMLNTAVKTDALTDSLCHDNIGFGVEQLILERRTARIDNKNFHGFVSSEILIT